MTITMKKSMAMLLSSSVLNQSQRMMAHISIHFQFHIKIKNKFNL